MRRIELAPRSPFHDLPGFVANVRKANPGITDLGVNQAVKRALDGYNPRHSGRIVHLYGSDIMTAQLDSIPAWPMIGDDEKLRLLEHPVDGGEVIPPEAEGQVRRMLQEELAGKGKDFRRFVNRSVLISPPSLRQTYVWRLSNGWMQEVLDADYDLILSTPFNRRLFRDPDIHGIYQDLRSYDAPGIVTSRTEATSIREMEYLQRQMSS